MAKRFLLIVPLALALIAGWYWTRARSPAATAWQGYADADFVKVGPTQQGLLTAVYVRRGDRIAKGAPLFDQDPTNDRAAADQAARLLSQAQNQLANLNNGGKPTEIAEAEASLADAEAARDKLRADLTRNQTLLKSGAASAQLVDQEQADTRSAEAKVRLQQAALAQLHGPMGRPEEIKAQQATVAAAQAALDMARWRLDQRHVVSSVAGIVADTLAEPGETLSAGAPVVSILPPENIYVRFFIPEADLAKMRRGEKVALACDGCAPGLTATISYIAPQAEYTPPVIYSESTRAKFVYLVEAQPSPQRAATLNPGQPVTVRPLEEGPPS